jgi:hexosaminidase
MLLLALLVGLGPAAQAEFKTLGAMIDVSRGRVLKVDYLKGRLDRMRKMGYNAVMLYTEDTFKLEGEPKWGYMRGGYTEADIRAIKRHADGLGMVMIPCIETLGHLEQPLRWGDYAEIRNTGSTLLVGEAKTYALIDKMVAFWAKTVGGTRIHVGMDEAWGFAGAKYEKKNGKRPGLDVFLDHLKRVNEICTKHGFSEVIIWSDMFYRIASKSHDYYDPTVKADPSVAARIPKNVRLCYWDYYHSEQTYYEGMIDGHRTLGSEPILAGGIQVWYHFLNDREKTLGTMVPMVAAARNKGVEEFFFTLWGDDGAYAMPDIAEEGLFACAELAAGRTAEPTDENCARFKAITGFDYRAMVKLGDVTRHYADEWPDMIVETHILYDDPLYCGNYRNYLVRKPSETTDRRFYCAVYKDAAWRDDGEKVMADYRQTLADCSALTGVPPSATALAKTLAAKTAYEADILAAWRAKDKPALSRLAQKDLPVLIAQMKAFMELYRADWYATSQPFGFERIQKRNAAALARLEEAQRRLDAYLAGKTSTIEELDEAMQPFGRHSPSDVIGY